MAINKTIFTADRTAQKSEILSWLQANAADYFDEISEDNNGNIVCSLENGAGFSFIFDSTSIEYEIESKTGVTHSIYGSSSLKYTKAGVVTSKGFMIVGALSASSDNIIIISKTSTGKTAVSMLAASTTGSNRYFSAIDMDGDADWLRTGNNAVAFSAPVTSLAPVCFSCGTHCEHTFFTPFTQFENPCIMQLNGKKYAYGGYLALEE